MHATHRPIVLMAVLSLVALTALPLQAQPPETRSHLISIDFSGGNLGSYIEAIRAQATDQNPVNVILDEATAKVELPAIAISNVPVPSAIELLQRINLPGNILRVQNERSIFIVSAQPYMDRQASRKATSVLSIKNILESRSREDLLSAIEIGMNMVSSDSAIELKLHEETGLLFAKGTEPQLELINEIVAQLNLSSRSNEATLQQLMGRSRSGSIRTQGQSEAEDQRETEKKK